MQHSYSITCEGQQRISYHMVLILPVWIQFKSILKRINCQKFSPSDGITNRYQGLVLRPEYIRHLFEQPVNLPNFYRVFFNSANLHLYHQHYLHRNVYSTIKYNSLAKNIYTRNKFVTYYHRRTAKLEIHVRENSCVYPVRPPIFTQIREYIPNHYFLFLTNSMQTSYVMPLVGQWYYEVCFGQLRVKIA